jgi:hypothetical protein
MWKGHIRHSIDEYILCIHVNNAEMGTGSVRAWETNLKLVGSMTMNVDGCSWGVWNCDRKLTDICRIGSAEVISKDG